VSAVEKALLPYETRLPSTGLRQFPVTQAVIQSPRASLDHMLAEESAPSIQQDFTRLADQEKQSIKHYIQSNRRILSDKYSLSLTPSRLEVLAQFYVNHILDIGQVFQQIKSCYDDIKKIELEFYKRNDINVVLEEDAIDYIMEQIVNKAVTLEEIAQQLNTNFELGLKLVMEKTGQNRFFINRDALVNPESFIGGLIRNGLSTPKLPANERSED
jgi:ATP-dependent Clp protease ATP-binding subunit ClpX